MQDNKILYSDASYDINSKTASISVHDLVKNRFHNKIYHKVDNILVAETMALKYSVVIAINENYDNVVFIYDNINIDIEKIKAEYQPFFTMMQFVWLKREFLSKVDANAKQSLRNCFNLEGNEIRDSLNEAITTHKKPIKKVEAHSKKTVLEELKSMPVKELTQFFKRKVFNTYEIKLIEKWEKPFFEYGQVNNKEIDFIRFKIFYHLLKVDKLKQDFYDYLEYHYPKVKTFYGFKKEPTEEILKKFISKIK